ncbi:hypothetical protein M9458_039565, partial [Cirrhinus mrigala]
HRVDGPKKAHVGRCHHRLLLRFWLHFACRCGLPHPRLAQAAVGHICPRLPLPILHL